MTPFLPTFENIDQPYWNMHPHVTEAPILDFPNLALKLIGRKDCPVTLCCSTCLLMSRLN